MDIGPVSQPRCRNFYELYFHFPFNQSTNRLFSSCYSVNTVTYHLDYLIELHYQRAKYLQLPAAERRAAARLLLGAGARRCWSIMSCHRGAQQQTRRTLQRLSNDGTDTDGQTDGRMDDRPLHRSRSACYAVSVNNTGLRVPYVSTLQKEVAYTCVPSCAPSSYDKKSKTRSTRELHA